MKFSKYYFFGLSHDELYCEKYRSLILTSGGKRYIILNTFGPVAQLGERSVRIREVKGSNPSRSTTEKHFFGSAFFNRIVPFGTSEIRLRRIGSSETHSPADFPSYCSFSGGRTQVAPNVVADYFC